MVNVELKEQFYESFGKKMLNGLTVVVDGKEVYTWDKNTLSSIKSKSDVSLKATVELYLKTSLKPLPKEDFDAVVQKTIEKIKSLNFNMQ
jgi:hypothetical protein